MKYLGVQPKRPRVAVFDFTGCEGCELQLANKEDTLEAFLEAIEIVNFREVSSLKQEDYEIAFIDGCISRSDEVERLRQIRKKAKTIVAMGSCACFGGVNRMKNDYNMEMAQAEVYGPFPKESWPTRAVHEVVDVDLKIPGCPINKDEVERIIQHIALDMSYQFPVYPVCLECKQRFTVCMFEKGHLCLGPVTRAGCLAPCPAGGLGCWGCRGPAADPNFEEFFVLAREKGFSEQEIHERLHFFGGFEGVL
jgi:sulfhydrogenase subunit delta